MSYRRRSWSLKLREKHRLRVFENTVLRRTFGPKRDEVTGEWRRLHNQELYALYSSPNIFRVIRSRRQMGRACSTYGGKGAYRVLVGRVGMMILNCIFKKLVGEPWIGLIWLRTGTDCGLLWMRRWTCGFHKMRLISSLAKDLFAYQEGFCSIELVGCFIDVN